MSEGTGGGLVERLLVATRRFEDAALALLLASMIFLASLQIFLRNFFDEGISWADPLLRVLVLWVGLLGAMAASRGGRHISIDALSRFMAPRLRAGTGVLTSLFTVAICSAVAYHSARFVADERAYDSIAFSGIPAWRLELIIPFAFGVIALRYLLYMVSDAAVALGLREAPADVEESGSSPG